MKRFILLSFLACQALLSGVRVNIAVGAGHPIRRPRTVVVQRAPVVVAPRVVYAPAVVWRATPVALPARPRLVWEDTEVIRRADDWVDFAMPVRSRGDALFLRISARTQIDFAEIHFGNGQVQVVDFNEHMIQAGTFRLIDFADGRQVETVRIVARARAPQVSVSVFLQK